MFQGRKEGKKEKRRAEDITVPGTQGQGCETLMHDEC